MKKAASSLVAGVLAGICIGLGGGVNLALIPTNRFLGAFLFTVGLFTICTFGFSLFTGKVCYLFDNNGLYAAMLPVIWIGNMIGTWIVSTLLGLTRLGSTFTETAQSLCEAKFSDSLLSLFVLAACCNMLIYIAVEGYKRNPHELGKYLSLVFGVTVFILSGFEHSVADMFYFAMAGKLLTGAGIGRIVVITLGNAVGGWILPLGEKLVKRLSA